MAYEARAMQPLLLPDLVEIGQMNPGRWRHIADTFVELGMLVPDYCLDGFLYDAAARGPWTERTALAAGMLLLAVAAVAATLWLFNRRLRATVLARTAELHAVNEQLRAVFDHTIDFLGVLEADGTVREVNRAALEFSAASSGTWSAGRSGRTWWTHSARRAIPAGAAWSWHAAAFGARRGRHTRTPRAGYTSSTSRSADPRRHGPRGAARRGGVRPHRAEAGGAGAAPSYQEWERTFDTVPDLICLLDRQHRIQRVNRAMCERLGERPEELVGERCTFLVHGARPTRTPAPTGPAPRRPGAYLRDGAAQLGGWYIVSASPLHDERGG